MRLFLICLLTFVSFQHLIAQAKGNINRSNANVSADFKTDPRKISEALFLNDSTMILEASVLMNVEADTYVAILSVTQLGEKLPDVALQMEERLRGVKNELEKNGFDARDIYIDFISQVPTYEWEIDKKLFSKTANEIPTGFELKKNIHIGYKSNTQLDKIILIAANYEIYDLVKVDYHIKNLEQMYDSLRLKAAQIIKKKILNYAGLMFFKPENLKQQSIAEDISSAYPEERYSSYTAHSSSVIKKGIKDQNSIKKNITFFYNKVSYNEYDYVFNPVILEPVVQLSCTVKVRYAFKR